VNTSYDAIVIGSGPNGLAAAIVIALTGRSVCIFEANATIGGGARSAELTLPGFNHDLCSAVHPLAAASPFFSQLPLKKYGLEFVYPPFALAHPFDDDTAVTLDRSLENASNSFGSDKDAYRQLFGPIVENWNKLADDLLGPPRLPKHPLLVARFGWRAIQPAKRIAESHFIKDKTRAVFAGLAAHSFLSLDRYGSAAFGLILGALTHAVGWPIARGGSQCITTALADYLRDLGGEITTNHRVNSLAELPPAKAVLCDVTPKQLVSIAGGDLPVGFVKKLRNYRYGPGAFKMDWALNSPVPWKAKACLKAATIHLGGSFAEILESERLVAEGKCSDRPFVILSQPSLFDSSRAPKEKHTLWGYCHVPNGSEVDMTERIEKQIERFAPGFRDCILDRRIMRPGDLEHHNSNLVGGDINGGLQNIAQMFTRPSWRLYSTPMRNLYLCSSSTPPGGGVHGLCGYFAAKLALRKSL
jgi:phytoene dehydrogenase-like protein